MSIIGSVKSLCFYPFSFIPKTQFRRKHFFLSFGDAILFLFKEKHVTTDDYILLPNFFCQATLAYLARYAKPIFYRINDDFTVDKASFFEQIKTYNPRLVIQHSLLGFSLDNSEKEILKSLCAPGTIIIEDFASRIVLLSSFEPINDAHYAIDSIRKHCSILGSHLLNYKGDVGKAKIFSCYKIRCHVYKFIQNLCYFFALVLGSKTLYQAGYSSFLKLDDIIGEPKEATRGSALSYWLYNFLDLDKIQSRYQTLLMEYNKRFRLLSNDLIKTVPDELLMKSGLSTYYPLLVSPLIRDSLLKKLVGQGIFAHQLWEWDESSVFVPFLKKDLYDSLVVFPLSYVISKDDIENIYKAVQDFLVS